MFPKCDKFAVTTDAAGTIILDVKSREIQRGRPRGRRRQEQKKKKPGTNQWGDCLGFHESLQCLGVSPRILFSNDVVVSSAVAFESWRHSQRSGNCDRLGTQVDSWKTLGLPIVGIRCVGWGRGTSDARSELAIPFARIGCSTGKATPLAELDSDLINVSVASAAFMGKKFCDRRIRQEALR